MALRAFHQADHAFKEAFSGICGDPHDDSIGKHARSAGHRAAVAAGFANDRCRFAGDRRLVDRRGPFQHVAVGGNDFVGLDDEAIALAQARARHTLLGPVVAQESCVGIRLRAAQRLGLRFAASFGDRLREIRE